MRRWHQSVQNIFYDLRDRFGLLRLLVRSRSIANNFKYKTIPSGIYLFKVKIRNTRAMFEISWNFTKKKPGRDITSDVVLVPFIVKFEKIPPIVLVFLVLLWATNTSRNIRYKSKHVPGNTDLLFLDCQDKQDWYQDDLTWRRSSVIIVNFGQMLHNTLLSWLYVNFEHVCISVCKCFSLNKQNYKDFVMCWVLFI